MMREKIIEVKKFLFSISVAAGLLLLLFSLAIPSSSSLFFEYGTENKTTFRIEDRTGKITASDRSNTSSLGFSEEDVVIQLTGAAPFTFLPADDAPTSNNTEASKDLNVNSYSWLFTERGSLFLHGSYIRFKDFSRISSNLSSVQLKSAELFLSGDPGLIPSLQNISIFYVYSNVTWNETSLTYNNQPCGANPILTNASACNLTVANISQARTGTWTSFDVTRIFNTTLQQNSSNFSVFILTNTTGSAFFDRRENSVLGPYLVVKLATQAAALKIEATNGSLGCIFYYNGNFSCTGTSSFSSVSGVVPDTGGADMFGTYKFINASRSPLKFKNITQSGGTNLIDTTGMFTGNYSEAPSFRLNIDGETHRKAFSRFRQSGLTLCNCDDGLSLCGVNGCSSPANESISFSFATCVAPDSPLNFTEGEIINLSYDPENGVPQTKQIYLPRLTNDTACAAGFKLYVADDGSTYYDAALTQLAFTKNYISLNGSQLLSGREFIRPEHLADVDDEDIESDLNTYVDIAGDVMTGNLTVEGNATFGTTTNPLNITGYTPGGTAVRCGVDNSKTWSCS